MEHINVLRKINLVTAVIIFWTNIACPAGSDCFKLSISSQIAALSTVVNIIAGAQEVVSRLVQAGINSKEEFYKKISAELDNDRIKDFERFPCLVFSDQKDPTKLVYYIFSLNEQCFSRITNSSEVNDLLWEFFKVTGISTRDMPDIREFTEKGVKYYQKVYGMTGEETGFIKICLKIIYYEGEEGQKFNKEINKECLANIVHELMLNPFILSEELCRRFNLTKDELIRYYRVIRQSKEIQDLFSEKNDFTSQIKIMRDMIRDSFFWENLFSGSDICPREVEFHLSRKCNRRCEYCWSLGSSYEKGKQVLTEEKIRQLITEFAENGVKVISFSGGKEPLLNTLTLRLIAFAKEKGLFVRLITNGLALNEKTQNILIDSGVDFVRVSLDTLDYDTYHEIYNGNRRELARIVKNLQDFAKLKKERGASVVKLGVGMLVDKKNYSHIREVADFCYKTGLDFIDIRALTEEKAGGFTEDEISDIIRQGQQTKAELGREGLKINFRKEAFEKRIPRVGRCWRANHKTVINPFGDVYDCSLTANPGYDSGHLMGNISSSSTFSGFWNDTRRQRNAIDPGKCKVCHFNESTYNAAGDKLYEDVKFGIAISDQPFVSEVDLSQGTGQRLDLEIEIFNELIKARSKTEDPLGPLRDRIKVRDEKIADIFQKLDNARFFDPGEEELYLDVVRKLNLFPGQRYLHVGISLYKIVIILSLLGVKCTFVDMEPCVIRVVKVWMKMIKNIKEVENSQIEFVNTNIDSFNGEDGYFDVITMFHVFYNFQGDEMIAMGNLLRMAKNKGRIWLQQETMMGGNIENIFANTAIQQGISIRKIVNSEIEDKGYRDITPNYGYRVNKNGIEVPFSDLLGKDLKEPRSLADCSA